MKNHTIHFDKTIFPGKISFSKIFNAAVHSHRNLEVAVVGAPDDNGLIRPKAFVVTKEEVANVQKFKVELRGLCKNGLALYKYPRWFEIVNELPKTATGKIQQFRLREGGPLIPRRPSNRMRRNAQILHFRPRAKSMFSSKSWCR